MVFNMPSPFEGLKNGVICPYLNLEQKMFLKFIQKNGTKNGHNPVF